jgi:hypothetical protein
MKEKSVNKLINNIKSYYQIDYTKMTDLEILLYYPSLSVNFNKVHLEQHVYKMLKDINNIPTDVNLYKKLYNTITQKTIIDDINYTLDNNENKIYELLMGSGKSKFIIPYVLLFQKYLKYDDNKLKYNELFNNDYFKSNYDEFYIITPSHLVNSIYEILLKFTYILPKDINIVKKLYSNDDLELKYEPNSIIILDDNYIKYNLLKDNPLLQLKDKKRLLLIDEIDDLINPNKSEFNILISTSNNLPQKEKLLKFIYDITFNYIQNKKIKEIIESIKIDNIKEFTKCYFNNDCSDEKINIQILYLIKKIYESVKNTKELIYNKDYGLSNN